LDPLALVRSRFVNLDSIDDLESKYNTP